MNESKEETRFERLAQRIDPNCRLLRTWRLDGGTSAQSTALEIEDAGGGVRKFVVRQHGSADLAGNPNVAADEFRLLQLLRSAGLPTPTAHDLDQSGEILSTPYVVIEYIEGERETAPTDLPDFIRQLATTLVKIHEFDCSSADLSFLRRQEARVADKLRKRPVAAGDLPGEGNIRTALESAWPLPPRNAEVLLHGDFWPGNTLWEDGKLVAIVDWEDATVGDPLADLANGRLEILWAFGVGAMNDFTQWYVSTAPAIEVTDLPYWDLWADLRLAGRMAEWGLADDTEQTMRAAHEVFVAQAFERLSVR